MIQTSPIWLRRCAAIFGSLGFLLFVLTPFLPVNQVQSEISWPQRQSLQSVTAPLVAYAPESLQITVPIAAREHLRPGENLLVGTLPPESPQATTRGLFVRSTDGNLDVLARDEIIFQLDAASVAQLPADAQLHVEATATTTTVLLGKYSATSEEDEDLRPQVAGIYTELDPQATKLLDAGLHVDITINSRYTSSPSMLKYAAIISGLVAMLLSFWALLRLDALDGKGRYPLFSKGFFRPRWLDAMVASVLGYWYIFGANTSDDGFILTMARASMHSDYMANYYRWFGVPESPFGAPYYDFLGYMAQVSTSSIWMRLPSLLAAGAIWLLLSREILPRLGHAIGTRKAAQWTTALMFLAFWLPYNNGLRPEPIIALGTLITWAACERAIAHQRLAPAAFGTIVAAFVLACGPTGLMAVSVLLISLPLILRIMANRAQTLLDWAVLLAPFAAVGTTVLVVVFGDQTLMTVLESIHVRSEKGPSLQWFQEWVRYETLFQQTVDGSFARRFAVLFAFLAAGLVFASMLRNGKVPGSMHGPSARLLMVFIGTLFFMSFTPTKWTHHFGVWAGIAAAISGLAAVALSDFGSRSKHSRLLVVGGLLFIFAFCLSGTNGFWYVSSYGVPWWDKSIQVNEIEASTVMLGISLIVLLTGTIYYFRANESHTHSVRFAHFFAAPIAAFSALAISFSMASMAKGFIAQYPAYSVGLGNLRSLTGNSCGLADFILAETNTNDSFLKPITGSLGNSLNGGTGFDPERIKPIGHHQHPLLVSAAEDMNRTLGVRETAGINGSFARLPFNLDPQVVPVVGSFTEGPQYYGELTTTWYQLPPRSDSTPLLVVSAAGKIKHRDRDGITQQGRDLIVEYAHQDSAGTITTLGDTMLYDVGIASNWRNLRLPLADLPAEANLVRLRAVDSSFDEQEWLAFTPPRVPHLSPIKEIIGPDTPGLLDWAVPLQFPCQRPFNHYAGVAEIPQYRISADAKGKVSGATFQDYYGGGATGTAEAVAVSYELPTYADQDWNRDWGALEVYQPRPDSAGVTPQPALIKETVIRRSGLWNPGHQNIETEKH